MAAGASALDAFLTPRGEVGTDGFELDGSEVVFRGRALSRICGWTEWKVSGKKGGRLLRFFILNICRSYYVGGENVKVWVRRGKDRQNWQVCFRLEMPVAVPYGRLGT